MSNLITSGVGTDYNQKTLLSADSCLDFDGVNQYVDCGLPSKLSTLQQHTISTFVKVNGDGTDTNNNSSYRTIFGSSYQQATSSPTEQKLYLAYRDSASGYKFSQFLSSGSSVNVLDSPSIVLDRWYHVVCTYSPSSFARIYLNGVKVAEDLSVPASINNPTSTVFTFGRTDYGVPSLPFGQYQRYAECDVSNLTVFDRALTDYEVLDNLYKNGGVPDVNLRSNVVAHYPLAQRESYSVLSGDTATSKGLSIGDYAAWDVSEEYNESKVTPITAQHGKLVNYPATVLASATNVSFKEFFDTSTDYRPISGGVETKTNLPPITECLNISTGKTIAIPNTTLQSIVLVFQVSAISRTLLTYTGGSIATDASNNFQQTGLTGASFFLDGCSLDNICVMAVNFDSKAFASLTIADNLDYAFTFFAFDRQLQQWEFKELFNNQLIYSGNPFNWTNNYGGGFQDEFVHGLQFQTGSISGASVTNYGSSSNATLTGFSIPTDIKTINSIR